jgi:DNA topoisomerase-1
LRFVTDRGPGISRKRSGRGFSYRTPDGATVRDRAVLARIRAAAIPPAWTDVWICPSPDGHIQATGRDARGRKQYRYHPAWQARRHRDKFARLLDFAEALPRLRERCDRDLRRPGLTRERVLAAIVRLLELTAIRVGNDEYARSNRSYGLTTLRKRHVSVHGSRMVFRFRGKAGRVHEVRLTDRRLARVVTRCQALPGRDLFQYVDEDGAIRDISSQDVNAYLRETADDDVSAKDFRTWSGTVHAYRHLRDGRSDGPVSKRVILQAIRETADRLGNTAAVTRTSYVHPGVIEAFSNGAVPTARRSSVADADEREVIALLRRPNGRSR